MLAGLIYLICLALASLLVGANTQQVLVEEHLGSIGINASEVVNLHLSAIPHNQFTALSHPRFPHHQVRVKKTEFCDPTVKYVTVFYGTIKFTPYHTVYIQVILMLMLERNICFSTSLRVAGLPTRVRYYLLSSASSRSIYNPQDDVMMWINGGARLETTSSLLIIYSL